MVAIATPRPRSIPARPSPGRPRLRAVPSPERSPGPAAGLVWSRRWSGAATVVATAVLAVGLALLAVAGPAPTAAGGEVPVRDATRVVAEGETMWSIARDLAPAGETAVYVERLVAANGRGAVDAGQVLVLPVP